MFSGKMPECDKPVRYLPPHGVEIFMTPGQQPHTRQLSVGGEGKPQILVKRKENKRKEEQQKETRKKETPLGTNPQDPNPIEPTQNPQPPGTPGRNGQKKTMEKGETARGGGEN